VATGDRPSFFAPATLIAWLRPPAGPHPQSVDLKHSGGIYLELAECIRKARERSL
jgi:hypothetical protein